MNYHEFRAMSTHILLAAEGPLTSVEAGFDQVQAFIEASEKRFTRFSEQSELSQLNRSAGTWFKASQEMFDVISQALLLHQQTQGLFDPAVLDALEKAGYDRTIEEVRQHGAPVTLPESVWQMPYRLSDIHLDPDQHSIWLPDGLRLDLGGIAKGWIAERAALLLSAWSDACAVDAGGDAFLIGLPAGENAWRLTLEDPRDPDQGLAVLKLHPGAVATSAITKRRWRQGDQSRHHLIDPRTRQPAETDWISVTAITPHAAEAEVFAKTLLIGGSHESTRIASYVHNLDFIAVDRQNKLWGSRYSLDYLDI
jgi:thiamine biosynthesis lipoprotein